MRKRPMLVRRRAALRWLAALCLLAAASHVLGWYCMTPKRALRSMERTFFTEQTEFLARVELPYFNQELRLSGGPDVTLLAGYSFSWRSGWQGSDMVILERQRDWPFTAEWYGRMAVRDHVYTKYSYIFGYVEDPAVAEMEIAYTAIRGGHDQTARLTAGDWIAGENGRRYFLYAMEPEEESWERRCSVTGYLADGTAAGTLQIMGGSPYWE